MCRLGHGERTSRVLSENETSQASKRRRKHHEQHDGRYENGLLRLSDLDVALLQPAFPGQRQTFHSPLHRTPIDEPPRRAICPAP